MQWKNKMDKMMTLQYKICMQVDDALLPKSAYTMSITLQNITVHAS
jgi:hypothetical protein